MIYCLILLNKKWWWGIINYLVLVCRNMGEAKYCNGDLHGVIIGVWRKMGYGIFNGGISI
jgi:hypothetical protein